VSAGSAAAGSLLAERRLAAGRGPPAAGARLAPCAAAGRVPGGPGSAAAPRSRHARERFRNMRPICIRFAYHPTLQRHIWPLSSPWRPTGIIADSPLAMRSVLRPVPRHLLHSVWKGDDKAVRLVSSCISKSCMSTFQLLPTAAGGARPSGCGLTLAGPGPPCSERRHRSSQRGSAAAAAAWKPCRTCCSPASDAQ
jgi:hypothetical protein